VTHLGNNTVRVASGASTLHIGGGVNGGGVGNNTVSVASGTSVIVIGGDLSGDDVGEGIHLSLL
jgi:hypothetical protein